MTVRPLPQPSGLRAAPLGTELKRADTRRVANLRPHSRCRRKPRGHPHGLFQRTSKFPKQRGVQWLPVALRLEAPPFGGGFGRLLLVANLLEGVRGPVGILGQLQGVFVALAVGQSVR